MSDRSEILFQLVVKQDGDKYTASTLSGSYIVTSSSAIDAVMNWGFRVREGICMYRNGEMTLEYFALLLGVSEAEAKLVLDSQEIGCVAKTSGSLVGIAFILTSLATET